MYEGLYAPLPDREAYLRRIGYPDFDKPGLTQLEKLIDLHQRKIVFENLDISEYGQMVSLEIPAMYEKMIAGKRGGFCFELNGLFYALLQELGYEVSAVMVRIVSGKDFLPPVRHRAALVKLEGTFYFCDVGFGGPAPWGAIPLVEGEITQSGPRFYKTEKLDDYWWVISLQGEQGFSPLFHVLEVPADPVDFLSICKECSTSPDSLFAKSRVVNLRTEDGSLSIKDDLFTRRSKAGVEEYKITSGEELQAILKKWFLIEL